MYSRLFRHLNGKTILVEQFGFMKNLTTEKATCELSNEIVSALNYRFIVGGNFCDLAGAFKCVNDILPPKLNCSGITDKVYKWIISYRRNRYPRVEIKNENFNCNVFF